MARPRKKINADQVEQLASIGCSGDEIAVALGCARSMLYRRFRTAMERGHLKQKASLRHWQHKSAKGGNVAMQIWLGKQLLGQRDKQDHEITGPGGGAIQVEHTLVRQEMLRDEQYVQFCRTRPSDADTGLFGGNSEQRLLGKSPSPTALRPGPNGNRNGNGAAGPGGDATPPREE